MIKKIISGGQSGADLGGLKAAQLHEIETGGTMPKYWKTEDGPKPEYKELYGLVESEKTGYPFRTLENVINSDATLIVANRVDSIGTALTIKYCKAVNKPYFIYNTSNRIGPVGVMNWIKIHKPETLNVAGNRESKSKGMEFFTKNVVINILEELDGVNIK